MRLIALALLSLPLAAQAAPSLSIEGECPGLSTIEITGLTPGGNMTMLFSAGLGEGAIPAGGCGGTITGLDPVRWAMTTPDVDGDGNMRFSPFMPESACGKHVQIMDPTDCSLSGIVTIGEGGGAPDEGEVLTEWTPFDFADNGHKDGCAGGEKYIINSVRAGSEDLYIGATLCSDSTYKLWMSDSIYGTFTSMRDTCGVGEDHCAHIGGSWDSGMSAWDTDDESAFEGWYDCGTERPTFGPFVSWAWGPTVYACSVSIP